MASSKLDILLNAKNNASGPIKQVKGDLGGLEGAASGVSTAMKAFSGLAVIGMVTGLAAAGIAAVDAAAQFQRLDTSFQSLATGVGQSSDEMLSAMRKASQGMISDQDLILSANKAMMLGVAKNSDEMVALMNIAAERGQAMGLSMSQAFNDIVTGLGRGSAMILDNLGIIIDADAANIAYAESLGKTAAALTEVEKKQALVNAVLAESSGAANVVVNEAEQLSTAWTNMRTEMALFISESTPLPGLLTQIAEGMALANTQMGRKNDAAAQYAAAAAEVDRLTKLVASYSKEMETANLWDKANIKSKQNQAQWALTLAEATMENTRAEMELAASLAVTDSKLMNYNNTQAAAAGATAATTAATEELGAALDKMIGKAASAKGALISSLMSGATDMAGGDPLAGYGMALGEAEKIQARIADTVLRTGMSYDEVVKYIVPQWISGTNEVWRGTNEVGSAVSSVNAEYNKLLGTINQVLNAQLNVGADVGVDPSDFLPREDAINENARRLADIMVNGFKGQDWMPEFEMEVPDIYKQLMESGDPKTEAAKLLRDFESGLNPELIDKEAAKQRVLTMITGGENMAELAQEIATEIAAEMPNISPATIKSAVGQSLGMGNIQSAGVGEDFASGAVGGVGNAGTDMVAVITAQLKLESNLTLVKSAGNTYGVGWGNAFLDTVGGNVPPALIDILVALALPGVQAGLKTQESLGGMN